jgi:prevent-host-death family protein
MKRTLSAVEARKKLGEILEGVFYRGDEVIIERAGKPMGVIIPAFRYANIERDRQEMMDLLEKSWERNKDLSAGEIAEIEKDIDEAVEAVRAERRAERQRGSSPE